jgi:hypothetical protein
LLCLSFLFENGGIQRLALAGKQDLNLHIKCVCGPVCYVCVLQEVLNILWAAGACRHRPLKLGNIVTHVAHHAEVSNQHGEGGGALLGRAGGGGSAWREGDGSSCFCSWALHQSTCGTTS